MVKPETTLTFYDEVNEIGGNKIPVKDGDTKVFFNLGKSFNMKNRIVEFAYGDLDRLNSF